MGEFWGTFVKELKNQWQHYENLANPPQNSGTGGESIGTGGGTGSGEDPLDQWKLVYLKFREIEGRDPYSFQELVDWWNRI